MAQKAVKHRFVELDLLRTLAIVMMILYHGVFDLSVFFAVIDINPLAGGWWLLARCTANLFLLLVGTSFMISYERNPRYKKTLKRGLTILGCAALISIATYVFDPATYIRFGILHLIGVSVLLLPIFYRLRKWNVLLGLAVIALGMLIPHASAPHSALLIPMGFPPTDFSTLDYFPLLPWFGVVLVGTAIGDLFYKGRAPTAAPIPLLKILSWPGRHALIIYLTHQPILLLVLHILHSFSET